MSTPSHPAQISPTVDNTDWLKLAAIILVSVDHFGYFFVTEADWWAVFGRLAAPCFFFMLGFAQTRTIPFYWIWLGVILTVLDSSNQGWAWVPPNILLSFVLIRAARPYVDAAVLRFAWFALVPIIVVLVVLLPYAAHVVDYGSEGWLWALFGYCQRVYVSARQDIWFDTKNLMRLTACTAAVTAYIWHEQLQFGFSQAHFVVMAVGIVFLAVVLCLFRRGVSSMQLPDPGTRAVRFIGRRTLEIYAIQLAGSEILIKLMPDLAG